MKKITTKYALLGILVFSLIGCGNVENEQSDLKDRILEINNYPVLEYEERDLTTHELVCNVITGVLLIPALVQCCDWEGYMDFHTINERWKNENIDKLINELEGKVYNGKYSSIEAKKNMAEEVAYAYKIWTSPYEDSDVGGAQLTEENFGKLDMISCAKCYIQYTTDPDYGWKVELGDENFLVFHYDNYEVVFPIIISNNDEDIKIDTDKIKFCIHEKGKRREVVLENEEVLSTEHLGYITGKILQLERYLSQVEIE